MKVTTLRSYINAPRWARVPEYPYEAAMACEVEIEVHTIRRLFRETAFFVVTGARPKVLLFARRVSRDLARHNES